MTQQQSIPIQPVENPILSPPYVEPTEHWCYDTATDIPHKTPGRRPASYWFKTERTGAAQMSLLAEEGETPLIPRLNRYQPIGSTEKVHFKTVKSHLSHVACDTNTWEQAAMFQLDKSKQAVLRPQRSS